MGIMFMCPIPFPGGYWVFSVVTAYNEGGEDMADTLLSLHEQTKVMFDHPTGILLVFFCLIGASVTIFDSDIISLHS